MLKNHRPMQASMFSFRVGEFVKDKTPPPIFLPDATCQELVTAMSDAKADCSLIKDPETMRVIGIITEADVTRRMAFKTAPDTPVKEFMSENVLSVEADDFLFTAIAIMQKSTLRHMPVVDSGGRPLGVLQLDKAMEIGAKNLYRRMQWMHPDGNDLTALKAMKNKQAELAEELLEEYVPVPHIQAVISQMNREINRAVIEIALNEMASPAPVAYAFLMMGSGGREENFLYPDQDNGIVIDDFPEKDYFEIDAWFRELSEKVNIYLDEVGYPLCEGYVMARNPMWRKTLSEWKQQTEIWITRKLPFAISYADIFFDFTHLYGERDLVVELRNYVSALVQDHPSFTSMLFRQTSERTPVPLRMFDRVKLISRFEDKEHAGDINMKHSVIMPAVQSLRHLSMKFGITETSSHKRLEALHAQDFYSDKNVTDLSDAFDVTTKILLTHQISEIQQGENCTNYVKYKKLSDRQKTELRRSLITIRDLQQKAVMEFTGKVL